MKKKNYILSVLLVLLAIIFTILVKIVDVNPAGANGTDIGFTTFNKAVFKFFGVHLTYYHITEILGLIALLVAGVFALLGLIQLIKRKSVFKVDKSLLLLGIFYAIVIILYVFFEKVIINYRPILMDGQLEASFPSSHTMMSIFICGSAIIMNKKVYTKMPKIVNILLGLLLILIVLGRLFSGVHWATDIIGGLLISTALLVSFYTIITNIKG